MTEYKYIVKDVDGHGLVIYADECELSEETGCIGFLKDNELVRLFNKDQWKEVIRYDIPEEIDEDSQEEESDSNLADHEIDFEVQV